MLTSYPSLPHIGDGELAAFFDDDADAIRRYRVLRGVLLQDQPQREAAGAAGVSERTVRNILREFRSGGMDAVKGRRGTARPTPRRWDIYEPALVTALAEEPHAGGDRLWQRAQEHLGEHGRLLSRRTAYRILARLRAEAGDDGPDDLLAAVRSALPLLTEDPPLSLGASPLARRLLPNTPDQLLRGTLVQQALRTALDRLRPAGEVSTIDRDWWPYLICTGEYEADQTRAELQRDLALSASTYSRSKRQGLRQIANLLPRIVAPMTEAPLTQLSQRLPRALDFVGRREEQSYYAWRLQTEGRAYLWGLPGSGKSALAAELAAQGHRYGQTILWHTCRYGVDSSLAGVMAGLMRALPGATDEDVRQASADAALTLERLRDHLLARPSVIVVDDAHRIDRAEAAPLFDMFDALIARGAVRLLLVGRAQPEGEEWPALPGLAEHEARMLWAGLPPLADDQWRALYNATAGFPQPLRRAAGAWRQAGELARAETWQEQVAAWARDDVWAPLGEQERRLLVLAGALDEHAWLDHAPAVLDAAEAEPPALERLVRFGLAARGDQRLRPHAVLRAMVQDELRGDPELRGLHEALVARIATVPAEHLAEQQVLEPSSDLPVKIIGDVPAGLDLLARLRVALEDSAAYLQHSGRDQTARQLAAELSALGAALPDPAWSAG